MGKVKDRKNFDVKAGEIDGSGKSGVRRRCSWSLATESEVERFG